MNRRTVLFGLVAVLVFATAVGPGAGRVGSSASDLAHERTEYASEGVEQEANGTRIHPVNGNLTLQAGPGRAIRGQTDVTPGTVVSIRVQSTDEDSPYVKSTTATVGTDGAFQAVFDFSELPAGTPLRVLVHREGQNLTVTSGHVVECSACPTTMPGTASALIRHNGTQLTVRDMPGQVIRGRTNLKPGTQVTIRLRSSESESPFIRQSVVRVTGNGTVRAVFDFADISQGTTFRAAIRFNGSTLTTAKGAVVCRGGCESTTDAARKNRYEEAEIGVFQISNESVARIPVQLGNNDAGLLTVSTPVANYTLEATLSDHDGDGTVVTLFDTSAAKGDDRALSGASESDGVRARAEQGRFTVTEYRLTLHPPGNESRAVATGLLVVTQNGQPDTPLATETPASSVLPPIGSAIAIAAGAALTVIGLALLVGLIDSPGLFDRL